MTKIIIDEIRKLIQKNKPGLTDKQKTRLYKIINPDIKDYKIYGTRVAVIEKIVKKALIKLNCSFADAIEIFRELISANIEEEKIAGFLFLNRFKKYFDENIPSLIRDEYIIHCHTWSVLDSTCIRVIGPFLAKKGNEELAKQVIEDWSDSQNIWIKRGSMVILLKIFMLKKEIDMKFLSHLVEKLLIYSSENYIEKGIGWLIRTCSKIDPDQISDYLIKNKDNFTRLILRNGSEKLSKERREIILEK
ncbi:MAG: DNA alkylation repair protein [Promethearchaeota archaeon]